MNAKELLDEYTNNLAGIDLLNGERQAMVDKVITPEIKARLAEIDEEIDPIIEKVNSRNQELIKLIKAEVIAAGQTISGDHHQAVYSKARVSWDTKGLDGYAVAHPEILVFRSEGNPSVSLKVRSTR